MLLALPLTELPQRLYIYAIIAEFLFVDALAPRRDYSRGTIVYIKNTRQLEIQRLPGMNGAKVGIIPNLCK